MRYLLCMQRRSDIIKLIKQMEHTILNAGEKAGRPNQPPNWCHAKLTLDQQASMVDERSGTRRIPRVAICKSNSVPGRAWSSWREKQPGVRNLSDTDEDHTCSHDRLCYFMRPFSPSFSPSSSPSHPQTPPPPKLQ